METSSTYRNLIIESSGKEKTIGNNTQYAKDDITKGTEITSQRKKNKIRTSPTTLEKSHDNPKTHYPLTPNTK
ncbi:hypothetical protein HYALB_00009858 [Hymenoscyphus albidus]|uniref:Uncharacterized protein n=1 Tax=Hymenoscyphus albidus TaxID=595503 RepID=A0A9N9QDQ6_9HELO|nr:hypothetical protein HYALB_00009858 [Hymenoscyphus albidus]